MTVFPLDWDSSFFDLRIGKIILNENSEILKFHKTKDLLREQFDLIYVVINDPDLLFDDDDALLVDRKTVYVQCIPGEVRLNRQIRLYNDTRPNQELYKLALLSGKYSRFRNDPIFPKNGFERLYREWIEQSVNNNRCQVFCYYDNNMIEGMLSLDLFEELGYARIGLTAVSTDYCGRGIGSSLIESACAYLKDRNITILKTVTQLFNIPACRWYEKNGFKIESVSNYYHWWLNYPKNENTV